MAWVIVLLLLNSLFAVAQEDSSSVDSSSCNWWCKVKAVFGGNVVGKAGAGCGSDNDCKGKRICVDSRCVESEQPPITLTFTSKLPDLKKIISANINLKTALENQDVDITKLNNGDETEIKKVQKLIQVTEDGLFGADSLAKLNTYVKTLSSPTPTPVTVTTSTIKKQEYTPEQLQKVIGANSLRAVKNGFTGDPQSSGAAFEPNGVTTYKKGDSYVHVYSDGTYKLVGQNKGNIVYSISFNGAGNVISADNIDFSHIKSDTNDGKYSDNQQLVDDLYNFGVITNDQYQDIKGTGVALEKDMAFVQQAMETNLKQEAAAALPPTGAAAPTKSCDTINDCQEKLKNKAITHGEAYDAMKIIADKSEKEYQEKKTVYDKKISDLGTAIKDGKIIITKDLEAKAKAIFNIDRQDIFISPADISALEKGDKIKIKINNVEQILTFKEVNDQSLVVFEENGAGNEPISVDINQFAGSLKAEKETDEALRARTQAQLDSLKPDETQSKKDKQSAESTRWQGTWWDIADQPGTWYAKLKSGGSILTGGFEIVGSLGSYRALSNLLFPDTTKEWSSWANDETLSRWADLPNFAAAEACGQDDAKRANQPGQSAAFITTTAGTFQAVGSIQAEKSPTKFPILCSKNKEDQWVCPKDPKDPSKNLVCKDNTYCYKDKNAEKPEEGYFYKITWGVTAPSDEKFTPYVDEDGVAVKFNVYLDKIIPLYNKKGITEKKQVLQLTNGGHDGGMIVRYLPTNYNTVCILFDKPIKDIGSDDINEICSTIIPSTGGVVEYASSSKAETVTSTSADVELDI